MDINTLSKDELVKLKADVEKAIKSHDARMRQEAKRAAAEAAKQFGFSLDQLVEGSEKGSKGVAKYRNPENADQTWTGRGRKPNWVNAWLEAGNDLEALAI